MRTSERRPAASLPALSSPALPSPVLSSPALPSPVLSLPALSLPALSLPALSLPALSLPALSLPVFFLTVGLLAGCNTEGVLPEGLVERGSLGSVDYAVAELYPTLDAQVEILRPRSGSPALLGPGEEVLGVDLWLAHPGDATAVRISLGDKEGQEHQLPMATPASCDPMGRCTLSLALPGDVPEDELLSICVRAPAHCHGPCPEGAEEVVRCRKGALWRFAQVPAPLRVAQITDLHVSEGGIGASGPGRLRHLVWRIAQHRPAVHLVVVTGDLTDDGRPASFAQVAEGLGSSTLPVLAMPGNHDFKDGGATGGFMDKGGVDYYLLHQTPVLDHAHRLGPYLLVALNTGPGRWSQERRGWNGVSFGLEEGQLAWLEDLLGEAGGGSQEAGGRSPTLVFAHYPPYSALGMVIGKRRRAFLAAVRAGGVAAILAGHTHRQEVFDHAGVAQGLPVRCAASVPRKRQPLTLVASPSLDRIDGGFRLVELYPDGQMSYCYVSVAWP